MIKTEFVEDAYYHAADLVAAIGGKGNRLDENIQRRFSVPPVERSESPAEIRRPPTSFQPDSGR